MSGHRWTWLVGATGVLTLAVGWGVASAQAAKRPVDWTALKPTLTGATFVNDAATCATCHEDSVRAFGETVHARALGREANRCEVCHGPGSNHIEDPTPGLGFDTLSSSQQAAVCMQCHEGGVRFGWKVGAHAANDVSCVSCHKVMKKNTERALLTKASVPETCYQCHGEVRGDTMKMSHHPVREGRLDCASCHNPHGSTPGLLAKHTVNETCTTCHTEKRGPFLWEHAPVRESCANCHTPHGSNNRSLLASKDAFLCLSCHSYGGHVNLPRYNRVSNPYGSGCVNCHIMAHGSNHPSGAKLTR